MSNAESSKDESWQRASENRISGIFEKLKAARVQMFIDALNPGPDDIVLDLGSEDGSYLSKYYPYPHNIVIADIHEEPMQRGVEKHGLNGYRVIPVEGQLPFEDGEFPYVWCNSVIEHVTIPRSELKDVSSAEFTRRADEHQLAFAREIQRIARNYFVQTPNVHFPIESHSIMPLVPYLPHATRYWLGEFVKPFWIKQWTADFYLYNSRRFRQHYSDATSYLSERAMLMTKSLIAVRKAAD